MQAGHQDGSWNSIPRHGAGTRWVSDARLYLAAAAPSAAPLERAGMAEVEREIWKEFHRYQGFRVMGHGPEGEEFYLRAIPVPKGADSLWHSVS